MAKYRVEAIDVRKYFIEVEADSVEEAWDIAEDAASGEFTEVVDPNGEGWEIRRPELIVED